MSVLLLRLAGPLQSWGGATRNMTRGTRRAPSKSGIVGLLAAALGRRRGADLTDLADLRLGVRVDQPGVVLIDYHAVTGASQAPNDPAAQRLPTASGGRLSASASTKITHRHYLSDAVFVAALEGPANLIDTCANALLRPRYPLFLGRRSCPPAWPVLIRTSDADLTAALRDLPWQASEAEQRRRVRETINENPDRPTGELVLTAHVEAPDGTEAWDDQPVPSPAFARQFGNRLVRHVTIPVPAPSINHDPMNLL